MGCATSANSAVLINGEPTKFLKSSRGLRQGCPLSPLLFLLIVEGLSKLIQKAKEEVKIIGIKIAMVVRITRLLFVDYVLLFDKGTLEEWSAYKEILDLFSSVIGVVVKDNKSNFLEFDLEESIKDQIQGMLPFEIKNVDVGFKYLGFYLKPNNYFKKYW